MTEAWGTKSNYTSIISANILLTKISLMAQSKVKGRRCLLYPPWNSGKDMHYHGVKNWGNISITSVYIPFLGNTHPHSLKYQAFAKDSSTYIPDHSCPLSSKHPWLPTTSSAPNISICISHTLLPVSTPDLTSAVVPSSTLLLKQEAEDHLSPIFCLTTSPHYSIH